MKRRLKHSSVIKSFSLSGHHCWQFKLYFLNRAILIFLTVFSHMKYLWNIISINEKWWGIVIVDMFVIVLEIKEVRVSSSHAFHHQNDVAFYHILDLSLIINLMHEILKLSINKFNKLFFRFLSFLRSLLIFKCNKLCQYFHPSIFIKQVFDLSLSWLWFKQNVVFLLSYLSFSKFSSSKLKTIFTLFFLLCVNLIQNIFHDPQTFILFSELVQIRISKLDRQFDEEFLQVSLYFKVPLYLHLDICNGFVLPALELQLNMELQPELTAAQIT